MFLVTGGSGHLGKEVVKLFPEALRPTHKELDITNGAAVTNFIKKNRPDKVIHLAAITKIRLCEENKELAWKTNVEGTRNLVEACRKHTGNCYFILMSTPCVFSGREGNYTESSIPYPKNFYGLTKLTQETIIQNSGLRKWLIIRGNFVPREKWPYPQAFTDRFGTYLFADDLAKAMKEAIEKEVTGIVHLVSDTKMSMFELAKMCPNSEDVLPMTLAEYQGPPLTVDMSLDTERWGEIMAGGRFVPKRYKISS